MAQAPDLFVVCKTCNNEVSPYITECPYCGTRLRKRAPKIERDGTVQDLRPPKRGRAKPAKQLAQRLVDRLREHAQDLGSEAELEGIEDLLKRGNGARRQVVVWEANRDLHEVTREIVQATAGEAT